MRNPDTTTISLEVLHSIARLTALQVPGVHATSGRRHGRHADQGVQLHVTDGVVDLDLFLVLDKDLNLRSVSYEVQTSVARAISEMLGMAPGRINIHIDDIFYPPAS
ncbi:MAG TPA: Asp23/Gls24 family envelope stress response protein [Anaerolineales bacterium]|nr:Asp23/Gls24 family envelope stress response protein [Anaerolineales bacterium]